MRLDGAFAPGPYSACRPLPDRTSPALPLEAPVVPADLGLAGRGREVLERTPFSAGYCRKGRDAARVFDQTQGVRDAGKKDRNYLDFGLEPDGRPQKGELPEGKLARLPASQS